MRIRPKKWLGQHFLTDPSISRKIAALVPADGLGRAMIEIGPGTGALTAHLPIEGYGAIHLLDVDPESIAYLEQHYAHPPYYPRLADFLELDWRQIPEPEIVIAGNFPYNISSQIFFKILEQPLRLPVIVCMVQKEVGRRLASGPGSKEYGILSVLLQVWYDISYAFTVKPGSFNPPPKVQSGVIVLSRNTRTSLPVPTAFFTQVVKAAFAQRRKQLRNALAAIPGNNQISRGADRAEQLSVEDFIALCQELIAFKDQPPAQPAA